MSPPPDFKKNPKTEFKPTDQLDKREAKQEVDALREGINFHDHRYYVENDPVISDATYDKLFRRLQNLEDAFPDLASSDSPTQRVGAEPLDQLQRVEHTAPMLSLNAIHEFGEFQEFDRFVRKEIDDDVRYVAEPKFDGVSVELVYKNGHFERGATRGDGRTGEDVTTNLRTIGSVPLMLRGDPPPPKRLAVRGEVFIDLDAFANLNRQRIQQGQDAYANPRNAAAGILRRLESREVAHYPLDIVFYDILHIEGRDFDTHWEELHRFSDWGLKTDAHRSRCSTEKEVAGFHERLAKQRDDLPYEIDGIVVKVNDKRHWRKLGSRDRSPRWAVAWKFSPREEVTTLQDIMVQVGRTGKLTPVALLQPVNVGGVTVSRATLHNENEVHRKDLRVGDRVRIARAGDVIPEVVERVKQPGKKRSAPFAMPEHCPVCGEAIVKQGAYHLCPAGLSCKPQLIGHITHYGSREALDIENLGEKTAAQLVQTGLVRHLADLYTLKSADLEQLDGFAHKSAHQLEQAIQQSKEPRLDRFLYGLGIRHVGRRVARILAEAFRSLKELRQTDIDALIDLDEIGPEIAESVHDFFSRPANQNVLDQMENRGVEVQDMPQFGERKQLVGKKFVFTGELESYTRNQVKERVEELGGHVTGSVSGETDYLVVGKEPGSKLDDAKQEGTEILDERQFKKLIGE